MSEITQIDPERVYDFIKHASDYVYDQFSGSEDGSPEELSLLDALNILDGIRMGLAYSEGGAV